MKNITLFFLLVFISFSASAQVTFDWTSQEISPGNNLKGMNIVNDTTTLLVGYDKTFVKSKDQGVTWMDVPVLDREFDFAGLSINSSGFGYAICGDDKVIDNPTGAEADVYGDGILLKTMDFGATWELVDHTDMVSGDDPEDNFDADGCYSPHFYAVKVLDDNSVYLSIQWQFWDGTVNDRSSQAGTFRSTDLTNWTPVTDSGYYSTGIEGTANDVYTFGLNHLFKVSAADGSAVNLYPTLESAGTSGSVYINDVTIVNEDLVFVITTSDGIYSTEDQGTSFTKLSGTGLGSGGNDIIAINDTVWMILGTSTKSKITQDSGLNWEGCHPASTCYEIGGILNDSIVGMGKSNIYKLSVADAIAGNYNWVEQEITFNENMQKMHINADGTAIIAGYGNTLVSTNDGGVSWTPIVKPDLYVYGADYDFEGISTVDKVSYMTAKRMKMVDFPSSSDFVDVHAHGLIFRTTDLWQTWDLLDYRNIGEGTDPVLSPNADGSYAMDLSAITNVNDTICYVFSRWNDSIAGIDAIKGHGNVFMTDDGGDSWVALFEDMGNSVMNQIYALDKDNVFVVGNTFFRKTTDGGTTWTDMYPDFKTLISDSTVFLNGMKYMDANTWYLYSSTNGVFVTEDAGVSYTELAGIGGGYGMYVDDITLAVLGLTSKCKISWDLGASWTDFSPGVSLWAMGGVLNGELIGLAKGDIYKLPLAELAPRADIETFVLTEQTGDAVIDPILNTVDIEVEAGTDPTALVPTITLSADATIAPESAVSQDFSSPVTYTVSSDGNEVSEVWTVTVTVFVGIEENSLDATLYPNPAKDRLYLSNLEEVERISVFSITGSSVFRMETPSNKAEIDLASVEDGIYFVKFTDTEGGVSTKKFVKN